MAEYIEREALREHLMSYAGMFTDELGFVVSLSAVLNGVDFQAAADVVEVKHGTEGRVNDITDITYCADEKCPFKDCERHITHTPIGQPVSIAYFHDSCRKYMYWLMEGMLS